MRYMGCPTNTPRHPNAPPSHTKALRHLQGAPATSLCRGSDYIRIGVAATATPTATVAIVLAALTCQAKPRSG